MCNLVNEVHHKTALWLCRNYEWILLPPFETSWMANRKKKQKGFLRKIGSKTVWNMYTWSHYCFRQFLHHKAREHPGCRVVEVREDYTSKTCGRCSFINGSLSSKKDFKCGQCHYEADRDANAARNILLRFLTESDLCPPPPIFFIQTFDAPSGASQSTDVDSVGLALRPAHREVLACPTSDVLE